MKKILLTALLSCATVGVFGQGVVQFRNYLAGSIDAPIRLDSLTGQLLDSSNTAWRAALIGGPVGSTPTSGSALGTLELMYNPTTTTITWVNFRSGTAAPAAPGYVNVGLTAARAVPSVNWGSQAVIQMVAWEGPYTDWASAWNAAQAPGSTVRIGWSNPLTVTLPTGPTDQNLSYLTGLNPFFIAPVPEPTTLALAGLGAAALLIFRRRN